MSPPCLHMYIVALVCITVNGLFVGLFYGLLYRSIVSQKYLNVMYYYRNPFCYFIILYRVWKSQHVTSVQGTKKIIVIRYHGKCLACYTSRTSLIFVLLKPVPPRHTKSWNFYPVQNFVNSAIFTIGSLEKNTITFHGKFHHERIYIAWL